MTEPAVDQAYSTLIQSDRVSARTRDVLLRRQSSIPLACKPGSLSAEELAVLRAVAARLLPQPHGPAIDLAARIDATLGAGTGDGWRFALLPADPEAYRRGLRVLDAAALAARERGFAKLDSEDQDVLLARAAAGDLHAPGGLDALQMRRWFEDLRADAVKLYVAHPATLARIGYSGVAYGGDGERKQGFHALSPGEREPWEPSGLVAR